MKVDKNINFETEKTLLKQNLNIEINNSIKNCIKYENNFFLNSFKLKNKKIIEFGCGPFPSSFGIKSKDMPKKYVATDVSNKIIKIAKKNDKRLTYKKFDLEKKFIFKEKFDIIILKGVLHHIKYPEKILINLRQNLKTDGIMIISEPNLSSVIGNFLKLIMQFFFNKSMEDSPYGQYSFNKISNSAKKAKLYITKVWYSNLLLMLLTGDYGRIHLFSKNEKLFNIFIFIEDNMQKLFNFFKIAKFIYFKVNIILKK